MIALNLLLLAATHMRDQTPLFNGLPRRLAYIGRVCAQMLLLHRPRFGLRYPGIQCLFQ
jgi:hypothetical protein